MTERPSPRRAGDKQAAGHGRHGGHGWMMIACCIPMTVIAITLVATGVVNSGLLFVAIACTAMMALMMWGMDHTGGGASGDDIDRSAHKRGW